MELKNKTRDPFEMAEAADPPTDIQPNRPGLTNAHKLTTVTNILLLLLLPRESA